MVAAVVITLEFAMPVACSVDMLSEPVVNAMAEALAGLTSDIVLVIAVEILTGMNMNRLAAVIPFLEFAMPTALEDFSC